MQLKTIMVPMPLMVLVVASVASLARGESPPVPEQRVQIVAEKMCCQGCARKISGQLYAARGVKSVEVDLESKTVSVTLPQPNGAMLARLWNAVEKGEGGPTSLVTSDATYTLVPPEANANLSQPGLASAPPRPTSFTVVIDNLHCQGCARKIAAQLYSIRGVSEVRADMENNRLLVETQPKVHVSPWVAMDAVSRAKERPLAIIGSYGTLSIEWTKPRETNSHQQAQQRSKKRIQK